MLPRAFLVALVAALLALATLGVVSCSSVNNQRIGISGPPFSQDFYAVGDFMVGRCGSLDCHGAPGRNLRIYGCDGLRLDADASTSCDPRDLGGGPTTVPEYQATYRSILGLEPQLMSAVWSSCQGAQSPDGGSLYPAPDSCHPEVLTFVAKARGLEKHKGGQLICAETTMGNAPPDPPCPAGVANPQPWPSTGSSFHADLQDVCIVTWLEGNTDVSSCQRAQTIYGFPPQDAGAE